MMEQTVAIQHPRYTSARISSHLEVRGPLHGFWNDRFRYQVVTRVYADQMPEREVEVYGPPYEMELDEEGNVTVTSAREVHYSARRTVARMVLAELDLQGMYPLPNIIVKGETAFFDEKFELNNIYKGLTV